MNEGLIDYYTELLIVQYNTKPKARAVIALLLRALMIYDVAVSVRDGFDIQTAIGRQLDILGKYIGANRVITGVDYTRSYFGYRLYGTTAPFIFSGYCVYGQPAIDAQFLLYGARNKSVYSLTDYEYRDFLAFKRMINYNQPSLKNIDDILLELIGADGYCTDNFDMTLTYTFSTNRERWATILKGEDVLPRPAGASITLAYV